MTDTATLPDLSIMRGMRTDAALFVLENANAKKSGVGGIKGLAIGRSDVFHVSPYDVHVEPGWNGRDFTDPENVRHVQELKESIKARGVEEPLTLRRGEDGRFYLVNGECRLRGVFGAIADGKPVESIPVRMSSAKATNAERIASQITLNTGKPFSPMEMARLCKRLVDEEGWDRKQIAAYVGSLTKERIAQLLALLEMPQEVQQQVAAGTVSATEAARVVKQFGDEAPEIIERAAALPPEEGGGNKPGKATRAALESVTRAPRAPESDPEEGLQDDAAERLAMLEESQREIARLNALVASLSATDAGREIAALQAQLAGTNARLQQAMKERKDATDRAEAMEKVLRKVRTALDVDSNGYILEAIAKLKGDA